MADNVLHNPFPRFHEWMDALPYAKDDMQRSAMTLATVDPLGVPSARIVLLRAYDERGFVFYTNMQSDKSLDLLSNNNACLNFCWVELSRQIRITGKAERVSDKEADDYYNGRPLLSRIGAWASNQSQPLESRKVLMDKMEELQIQYSKSNPPPRPPHWSGWRVVPSKIEFWQEGSHRLHDRDLYTRTPQGWALQKLYP